MASPLREKILAADTFGGAQVVDVPEWGTEVVLRPPSGRQRSEIGKRFQAARTDPNDPQSLDLEKAFEIYPALLIVCVRDGDGNPVFTDADTDALMEQNGSVVERVAQECMKVAGFDVEAVEAGKDD